LPAGRQARRLRGDVARKKQGPMEKFHRAPHDPFNDE
jgi:hypothetical protein